jgi:hypothetical protein
MYHLGITALHGGLGLALVPRHGGPVAAERRRGRLPVASSAKQLLAKGGRHLIGDRLDITGARWGLDGAEAILTLRAVISNGDFDDYWGYHLAQEHQRLYPGTTQGQSLRVILSLTPNEPHPSHLPDPVPPSGVCPPYSCPWVRSAGRTPFCSTAKCRGISEDQIPVVRGAGRLPGRLLDYGPVHRQPGALQFSM